MNRFKIAVAGFLMLIVAACSKQEAIRFSDAPVNNSPDTVHGVVPKDSNYLITEDFEKGTKNAYKTPDTAILKTGVWNFDDALIGNTASDRIADTSSVRIENTGSITTKFQVHGLKMVYVSSKLYGSDAATSWQLQTSTDGQTFTQVGNTVNVSDNQARIDSFAITSTNPVQIRILKSSTGKRLNIDNVVFKGTGNSGIVIDTTTTPNDGDSDTSYYNNPPRNVVADSHAQPNSGDNSNMLLGNPSNADSSLALSTNYLINQHYYIESYNASRGTPNWTAWHLDASDVGSSGRGNNFAAWESLPQDWYQVGPNDYVNSGFDRGHNCPSGDRTASTNANDATFLMTNMMPQAPVNNQQTWEHLEDYTRTQISSGSNEAYIIAGSYGQGGIGKNSGNVINTIANGKITVPQYTWKIVIILPAGDNDLSRINASTRVIAVIMPNINTINTDWTQYIVTAKDIETATGYTFFSALNNSSLQATLENKKDSGN